MVTAASEKLTLEILNPNASHFYKSQTILGKYSLSLSCTSPRPFLPFFADRVRAGPR